MTAVSSFSRSSSRTFSTEEKTPIRLPLMSSACPDADPDELAILVEEAAARAAVFGDSCGDQEGPIGSARR